MSPRELALGLFWRAIVTAPDTPVPEAGTDGSKIALYAMISAIVVAIVTVAGNVIINRGKSGGPGSRTAKRAAAHYEACKLWISLNTDADPRKIKDGYETLDEVRRAGTP